MTAARLLAVTGAILCLAAAADPADRLAEPGREARARALFRETRCLVCQGESIDDSDAALADDLRRIVRAQVRAGRTDGQIRAFLAARYGDFVLLRPPFSIANAVLWSAPFLVALLGAGLLVSRRRPPAPPPDLSAEEEARLAALGGDGDV
ncbi:MAG: cytochrome c-type biogenesis protein [Caulobacteraceae bacterium]